jgi:hypothetical protein
MYLDAAQAAVAGWGAANQVKFQGSPTVGWLNNVSATTAMLGAEAYAAAVYTDETTGSNNAAPNDMTLLAAAPAVGDAYYFGYSMPFTKLTLNIGTQGVKAPGDWTIAWEYYNGTVWTALGGLGDGTAAFTAAVGNRDVTFTLPTAWEATTVNSVTGYWIRARVTASTNPIGIQPLGTQSWINGLPPPFTSSVSITWHATTTIGATSLLLGANVISWATTLSNYWAVALTTNTSDGFKLSTYGDQYFTNAIPNLRTACPQIFLSGSSIPSNVEPASYSTPYKTALENSWPFDTAGLATWFGLNDDVFKAGLFFLIFGMIAFFIGARARRFDVGMFVVLVAIPIGARLGWISLTLAILAGVFCAFALLFAVIFQRGAA